MLLLKKLSKNSQNLSFKACSRTIKF